MTSNKKTDAYTANLLSTMEREVKVRHLKKGMRVISRTTGKGRTLTTNAMPCQAKGYFLAQTDSGEPINTHGDNTVLVELPLVG